MKTRVCSLCQQAIQPEEEVILVEAGEVHLACFQQQGRDANSGRNPLFRD